MSENLKLPLTNFMLCLGEAVLSLFLFQTKNLWKRINIYLYTCMHAHTHTHTHTCTDRLMFSGLLLCYRLMFFKLGWVMGLHSLFTLICAQLNLIPITSVHEIMTRLEMESLAINSGLVILSIFSKYLLNTYHSYSKMIAVV